MFDAPLDGGCRMSRTVNTRLEAIIAVRNRSYIVKNRRYRNSRQLRMNTRGPRNRRR